MENPVIALLTDFGDADFFVGSMKGVIAGINPAARTIDISHHIPSFNIIAGSFALSAASKYFPAKTIFLAVVDPGVGSTRKICLVETEKYFFIAPDNGVLSLILDEEDAVQIREVTNPEYFLPDCSHTFEARDKMAPAAAWLSKGVPSEKFGPRMDSTYKERIDKPEIKGDLIIGSIIYADKFGNLITNIPTAYLEQVIPEPEDVTLSVLLDCLYQEGKFSPKPEMYDMVYRRTYGEARKNELLILAGSLGLLELAVREGSAADKLQAGPGTRLTLSGKYTKN
ncbi:S-adenosyl-l-methionine hydroxide adenosyltransferase family protein [Acidobacteriota bacterium]